MASLYFALTRYQHRPEPAATVNTASGRIPNSSGFANGTVMFTPESAGRGDSYRHAHSTPSTLVIDYEILAAFQPESGSPASVQTAPAPTARRPNSPVKPDPAQKDSEIEVLRKELQEVKQQLAEQDAQRIRSQRRNSVAPK